MTSMLLTASSGAAASFSAVIARSGATKQSRRKIAQAARDCFAALAMTSSGSAHLAGIGRQVLVAGVFLGCRFDHRPHQLLVGINPVGDEIPALAVPLEDP